VRDRAAGQERPELVLDEPGQARAAGAVGSLAQEGFQVCAHNRVEDALLGRAGPVFADCREHALE
jgi:hypothetical protein